jgi:hypothetical protein
MGVKVERMSMGMTPGTVIDDYPEATSFYYHDMDKIMYVQVEGVAEGPTHWQNSGEAFLAAYPKGQYIRAYLDPVPPFQTSDEVAQENEEGNK